MKTKIKPENRSWPRENARNTAQPSRERKARSPSALFASLRLKHAPQTAQKRDFEQEATERTESRKGNSLRPISLEIRRPFIRLMSSFESVPCSLCSLLFKTIWFRSSLCALCALCVLL